MSHQVTWNGQPQGQPFAEYRDAHTFKGASMAKGVRRGMHATLWKIVPSAQTGIKLTPDMIKDAISNRVRNS